MTTRTPPPGDVVASLLADSDPYLSCDECFARLDEHVERLARDPRHHDAAMSTHLAACAACADEADSLLALIVSEPG
jgi:hypothetical protein